MGYRYKYLWYGVLFLCLLAQFMIGCSRAKDAPNGGSADKKPRLVIGYYENPWPGTPDRTGSYPSMKAHGKSMTGVGPFWYKATSDGTLEARDSQLVYDSARQLGLAIFPLVTNKTGATEAVLGDSRIRSLVTDNIVKLTQEKQYDGINIDFELLPPTQKDNLTAFMRELYPKMKAANKTLIISVFPKVDVGEDVSGAYDYKELAQSADYLQIMTYDNHWATSEPGPLAPLAWYEKNLQYAIEECGGPEKVLVGLGAYGYDWSQDKKEAETLTYADAIVRAEQNQAKITFDTDSQSPHFSYGRHTVWFENAESTTAKLDVIAKHKPAGIAVWRLGQEQPEIWDLIEKKFSKTGKQ